MDEYIKPGAPAYILGDAYPFAVSKETVREFVVTEHGAAYATMESRNRRYPAEDVFQTAEEAERERAQRNKKYESCGTANILHRSPLCFTAKLSDVAKGNTWSPCDVLKKLVENE